MEDKNVEINFYGKVVDQNDHPLAGAAIQAETREWFMKNPFEPGGKFLRPVAVTGADGLFRFTRLHGDALGILSITKEGYKLTTKAKVAYSYGPLDHHFVPNSLMPVIFHMWRTNGAVPLYVVDISMSIPQDGTELSFDLRRNKRVTLPTEDTDLRVTLSQHAPPGQRGVDPHFDWSFTIEALNGGLLQAQAEFTYLAPEQGYHPKLAGEYHKEQSNWKFQDGADFYLHNRGQQYGRLSIHFKANAGYPTGYLTIRGYLNPNGRVLEFDTFKKLYPPPMGALGGSSASVPVRSPVQFTLPSAPGSVPPGVPAFPQPPPGFEALTNRARGFAPPVPPRPPQ